MTFPDFSKKVQEACATATPTVVVAAVTAAFTSKPAVDLFNKIPKIGEHIVKVLPQGEFTRGVNLYAFVGAAFIHVAYRVFNYGAETYAKPDWFKQPKIGKDNKPISVPSTNEIVTETPWSGWAIEALNFATSTLLVVTVGSVISSGSSALQLETLKRSGVYAGSTLFAMGAAAVIKAIYDRATTDKITLAIKKESTNYINARLKPADDLGKLEDKKGTELAGILKNATTAAATATKAANNKKLELNIEKLNTEVQEAQDAVNDDDKKDAHITNGLEATLEQKKKALKEALENPEYVGLVKAEADARAAELKAQADFDQYAKPTETSLNLATNRLATLVKIQQDKNQIETNYKDAQKAINDRFNAVYAKK